MNKLLILFFVCCSLAYSSSSNSSEILQQSFIYSPDNRNSVVFRKTLEFKNDIEKATLKIFADSYYSLYINDRYVLKGPGRFDPLRPEYDSLDVAKYMMKGKNLIAVLVYGGISSGSRMHHQPGLTIHLEGNDFELVTDTSWKCSSKTKFKEPRSAWNGIKETIDASSEVYDCLSQSLDDSKWSNAVFINGNSWGKLIPRILPLLEEREIKPLSRISLSFITDTLRIFFDKNYLVNVEMKFKSEEGIKISFGEFHYTTRKGVQTFRAFDSFGITDAQLKIALSGKIKLLDIKFFNRVYPFKLMGSFECSDKRLNRLWQISTHTLQQCTEDGYQDCPWERAEWMGDAAMIEYPLTRVAFQGPGSINSDPRLIKKIISDISLSQDSLGRLKAHHPSDRFDIHAYIEDYSCLWIQALKDYYEYTGDTGFIKEMSPVMHKLLFWFLSQQTENQLIRGREFVFVGNPVAYKVCIGATLNAFIYKALLDGAFLANVIGNDDDAVYYRKKADELKLAFNKILWNDFEKNFNASTEDKPNYHSALIALDKGIVTEERIPLLKEALLKDYLRASETFYTYTHSWFFKFLFNEKTDEAANKALDIMRKRYAATYSLKNTGFTGGESFELQRPFHNFGSSAAYFMSADILGVKIKLPLSENTISIQPQLGDLSYANGTVVSEHGLVSVSWNMKPEEFQFSVDIPASKKAILTLPIISGRSSLYINEKKYSFNKDENFAVVYLTGGVYSGKISNE